MSFANKHQIEKACWRHSGDRNGTSPLDNLMSEDRDIAVFPLMNRLDRHQGLAMIKGLYATVIGAYERAH